MVADGNICHVGEVSKGEAGWEASDYRNRYHEPAYNPIETLVEVRGPPGEWDIERQVMFDAGGEGVMRVGGSGTRPGGVYGGGAPGRSPFVQLVSECVGPHTSGIQRK